MKLSKREIVLIGILTVVGGTYFICKFIFHPLQMHKVQITTENMELRNSLLSSEQTRSQYADIKLEEQKLKDEYSRLNTQIPQYPSIPDIVTYLETSSQDAQVKLLSVNYKADTAAKMAANGLTSEFKTAQSADFQVTASGSYLNLVNFVSQIENAPRLYNIKSGKIILRSNKPSINDSTEESERGRTSLQEESALVVKEKESLAYNQSNAMLILDFTAYFESSQN